MKKEYKFVSPSLEFESDTDARQYARDELIYNVTEDILVTIERSNLSKAELAKRLNKSKSFVTQLLSGARNMTLGTLSDICFSLQVRPKIKILEEELSSAGVAGEGVTQYQEVDDGLREVPKIYVVITPTGTTQNHSYGSYSNPLKKVS